MKSISILVLACLVSMPVLAQSLPDEINYGPYETRYRTLERDTAAAESQLSQSRASLAEAQKFIREETAHIEDLRSDIAGAQSEIDRLRSEIPQLQTQISSLQSEDTRVQSDLRSRQAEEGNLSYRLQDAQRNLRPLEEVLARKQQRIRELEYSVNQTSSLEREASQRLARSQSEAQRMEGSINELRGQIRALQSELAGIDSRISSVQSQISSAESGISSMNSSLSSERAKLGALQGRVSEYEAEVSRLRSSGAPAEQIADAERKLNAARNTMNNTAQEVRNLESQISRQQSQISSLRNQIDELRRNQQTIPSRISQLDARARQIESERMQTLNEIQRYANELQNIRRNLESAQQQLLMARNDIRSDEQNVMRQRQLIENLDRQLDGVRDEIARLTQRSRTLNSQIANLQQNIRIDQAKIPQLEQGIRNDQAEIAQGEADLARARNDERTFTAQVARDEAKLSDVTNRRDSAKTEWSQRLSLFNQYMDQAEALGSNQAGMGTTLGQKEGEKLSSSLARQNGQSVGRELGLAEAKHWGSVRGEIQGYDQGHNEGLASREDIDRATLDASSKAATDAELFAQTNFKPVFFEEFVQEAFKRPLPGVTPFKSMKGLNFSLSLEEALDTVPPLSPNEISLSDSLVTPLDAQIQQVAKEVKSIQAKAKKLSDPEVAFQTPQNIPYGIPACAQVYKNLAVFKTACEGSYKGSFAQNFVEGARSSFSSLYTPQFQREFDASEVSAREASYAGEFSGAQKVGRAEGLRVGKIEIYQSTYASVYKSAYAKELEVARAKAKVDAGNELSGFLKSKPLLTTAATSLNAENFRGGEEVLITGKVKNVSQVTFNGAALFRITDIVNAEKVTGDSVLNSAAAGTLTDLPQLKVKVLPGAKAGEKVIVKGVIELPGDLYKQTRVEKFELTQILSANPAHDLKLNYNKTPDIKGVFRRNVHFLTSTVTPIVEEIKDGYTVALTPKGDAGAHMDFNVSSAQTGALAASASKDIRLSYVFKDSAKGKSLELELSVSYLGKVIKTEVITLQPH